MLSEPENPRVAYGLAAALAIALIAGWFVLNRTPAPLPPAAAPAEPPPKSPPRSGAAASSPAPGTALPPRPAPPTPIASPAIDRARGNALLAEFDQALARAGHPPAGPIAKDLLALFQVNPVDAIPANPTAPAIAAAIAQRRSANENILAMSTALLNPAQLAVFRAQLETELQSLEARRRSL